MVTKKEIRDKCIDEKWPEDKGRHSNFRNKLAKLSTWGIEYKMMDEYAKTMAIEFARFRDDYKRAESDRVSREQKRLGGIFTWIGDSDETIHEQFIASIGCPIKFRHPVFFDIISEKHGELKKEGRAVDIDYINKTAVVEYFNTVEKVFEFKKFQLSKITSAI